MGAACSAMAIHGRTIGVRSCIPLRSLVRITAPPHGAVEVQDSLAGQQLAPVFAQRHWKAHLSGPAVT